MFSCCYAFLPDLLPAMCSQPDLPLSFLLLDLLSLLDLLLSFLLPPGLQTSRLKAAL